MTCLRLGALAVLLVAGAAGQAPVRVLFLEPVSAVDTRGAEISDQNLLYRMAANPERYTPWLNNESAARAFRLYRDACEIAHPGGGVPDYYVALVKGGNHAATGWRTVAGSKSTRGSPIFCWMRRNGASRPRCCTRPVTWRYRCWPAGAGWRPKR